MTRRFVADFHVHSVLSPCAEVEMTPRNILWHADRHGVDIVAITDHNAGDNVRAAMEAAKDTAVTVLPGMEVETKEEIHLIVLFDKLRQLAAWEQVVAAHRPDRKNDPLRLGAQFVVDATDELICEKQEMLLAPLALSLEEVCDKVAELGGLTIASHVDRPAYSILSQLGFIPPGVRLTAVEVSPRLSREEALKRFPTLKGWPMIKSSDAHTIADFVAGPKTALHLEAPTLAEIRQALHNENGREVVW